VSAGATEDHLTIGEAARRAGVATSTLRYWESEGLLPATRVNGRRHYDEQALRRLAVIDLAKRAGFTVAEIRRLFRGFPEGTPPSERWKALAEGKLAEIEALIESAEAMRSTLEEALRCRCASLEDCARLD
jgi:MerR family transcriptional regulator, redox-sensitive transcriptional activator SoxR